MIIDPSFHAHLNSSKAIFFDLKGTLEYFNGVKLVLVPGAYELLDSLNAANKRIGLVTSTSRGHAISMLSEFGISNYFEFVIANEDVDVSKPSSEPYIKALKTMKLSANDCIVFEDSYNGLRSAKGAGLFTVYLHYASNLVDSNCDLADACIDSYEGLDTVIQ